MLNSKKLLYILPDVSYVIELLPSKKEGEFDIHNFRQINGQFMDDNSFIAENVAKLFTKIDKEEYSLILPDFLFTNTIVEVKEKAKTKVEKHLKEKLLPKLKLDEKTHQVHHFILTEYKGVSKVQLSALENSVLAPIYKATQDTGVKIEQITSLSWTIKSIVSLEPSLSIIQMGDRAYLSQHYIGVDQANDSTVEDIEKLGETIKTLKGAEPSLQTSYLLTNELVFQKLTDQLKATLPLQQLTDFKGNKKDIPSYVKQIIEAGAKTLSIKDFNVPEFELKGSDAVADEAQEQPQTEVKAEDVEIAEVGAEDDQKEEALPEPTTPPERIDDVVEPVSEPEEPKVDIAEIGAEDEEEEEEETEKTEPEVAQKEETVEITAVEDDEATEEKAVEDESESKEDTEEKVEVKEESDKMKEDTNEPKEVAEESVADLSQFALGDSGEESEDSQDESSKEESAEDKEGKDLPSEEKEDKTKSEKKDKTMSEEKSKSQTVIKNKSGVGSMLKMIFIFVSVFFVTVGVGVGVGIGFITLSQRGEQSTEVAEVVDVSPSPEAVSEPSPSPSPVPEVNNEELAVLVVNATKKAGYAGEIGDLLEDEGFVDIDAANAKGDYEEGNYVLMAEENEIIVESVAEATDLEFEYSDKIETEDAKGAYDLVVVLAE